MKRSIIRRRIAAQPPLGADLHPLLRRIYLARNITSSEELDYSLRGMLPWQRLHGIGAAVDLLVDALAGGRRILVVADYDADGATGCVLALRGLRLMGARDVRFLVPSRFEFGYGLSPELVELAARQEPDLLMTVDNGISSIAGVRRARDLGMRVLVTDHHLPGAELPAADAIVNPNQPGDDFPSKNLAGVGVMFYLLAALRSRLRDSDWFTRRGLPIPRLAELLDLVALGTVADVVPLDHNNRILVAQGLARIRSGRCVPGISALLRVARRDSRRVSADDLGFAIGPRLNAAGRLADMSLGIECLLSDDAAAAADMAVTLDGLNRERRQIQEDMQVTAETEMEALNIDELPFGLCLFRDDWHQGVVGILASRIRDRWHRPAIAFARDDNGLLKGSGRSIRGLHLRDALEAVASQAPGLIDRFGGHAMAAGLTITETDLPAFRDAFDQVLRRKLSLEDLRDDLLTDGELPADDIHLPMAEAIFSGGPWGQGFPEPLFDGVFEMSARRIVGEQHLKMSVRPRADGALLDAIAFFTTDDDWPARVQQVHLAYRLGINDYQGRRQVQLVVEHVEPL